MKNYSLEEACAIEPEIRSWVFGEADTVRFRHVPMHTLTFSPISWFLGTKEDWEEHRAFKRFIESMSGDLIKREGDYYIFRFSARLKDLFNHQEKGILYAGYCEAFSELEDPTFYKNGQKIAEVTSHCTVLVVSR